MKINENEDIGSINPRVDEYINKLLDIADGYGLDGQPKNVLNYVIYLLLNKKFQLTLSSFRTGLSFSKDGFKNEEEQYLWEEKFREVVNRHHNGEAVEKETKLLIGKIESDLHRPLVDKEPEPNTIVVDICSDAIIKTASYLFQYLNLKNTKNIVYWLVIIRELLLFNSPAKIISHLSKWSKVFGAQSLHFEQENNRVKMTVMLYPDTTIKDIKQLIELKSSNISEEISKIKGQTRKNQSKTDDIKSDYFIYRTYMDHASTRKRGDNIYFNVSKKDAVKNKAKQNTDLKEAKRAIHLEDDSIRKIVDRMNKRIKEAFPNSPTELNMSLGVLAPKRHT